MLVPNEAVWRWLDRNGDQAIEAFEAADAILIALDEVGKEPDQSLSFPEIGQHLKHREAIRTMESAELFAEFDRDGNEMLIPGEIPPMFGRLVARLDEDGNGSLNLQEFQQLNFESPAFILHGEAEAVFEDWADGDSFVKLSRMPAEDREEFEPMDIDGDGRLSLEEVKVFFFQELNGASFEVDGTLAHMRGTLGPTTPARVMQLVCMHPQVQTIVMHDVPGSLDDESNLRAARLVRRHELKTVVPEGGVIASGGVDFFLSGAQRYAARGGRFGIHSWAGELEQAIDLPRDHEAHQMFLEYYSAIGIAEEFYWRTLEAAPPEDIHWMTEEELKRYDVLTQTDWLQSLDVLQRASEED